VVVLGAALGTAATQQKVTLEYNNLGGHALLNTVDIKHLGKA